MNEKNTAPDRAGQWMQVSSGGKFFPQDPRPEEVHIEDIANGLALTCRYGGQGDVNKFYSVAEHSVLMARYVLDYRGYLSRVSLAGFALCALMHDAAEAYTGDLIVAVKTGLLGSYAELEGGIQKVIMEKYNLTEEFMRWSAEIKEIDRRIVVNEKTALFPVAQTWVSDGLTPLEDVHINYYKPWAAKETWLNLFRSLCGDAGGSCF